jgi:hypothetical protein
MLGEAVHASLLLTNRLLGPIVPRDVIEALQPMVRSRVRSWLADGLSGDHSATPAQRFIASRWEGIGPRKQVRLARLMGLAEMAAPTPRTLEAIANSHGNARLLVRYVQHTGRVLVRAGSDFLRASVDGGRARRAGTQKR